jgi:hypothetical protein
MEVQMSWLRIDDGFAEHYKIAELTDREFRVWVRILCYAARNNGRAGRLTAAMRREIVGLTDPMVKRFLTIGLLDDDDEDGVLAVHDWRSYNPKDPTAATRMKRHRNRNTDRNDSVTNTVTPTVTEPLLKRNGYSDSRVGARARPVPSPKNTTRTTCSSSVSEKILPLSLPKLATSERQNRFAHAQKP